MKQLKRLFYYLLINVAVSACTIIVVLNIWDRLHPAQPLALAPVVTGQPASSEQMAALSQSPGSPTPEPSATPRPLTTYRVKAGDTLGGIALELDIPVSDLMEINGMKEDTVINVGQVLFVPVLAEASPTAEATQESASGQTATPQPAGMVVISNVFGAGDLATERVRLERRGEGNLSLEGWKLSDEDGNTFTFPFLTLFKDGAVDIYTSAGANSVTALFWGQPEAVWQTGETVKLSDLSGNVQATFIVP